MFITRPDVIKQHSTEAFLYPDQLEFTILPPEYNFIVELHNTTKTFRQRLLHNISRPV